VVVRELLNRERGFFLNRWKEEAPGGKKGGWRDRRVSGTEEREGRSGVHFFGLEGRRGTTPQGKGKVLGRGRGM